MFYLFFFSSLSPELLRQRVTKYLDTVQNYPLTDDWRRHIDARRRALQRKRTKRRMATDGTGFHGTPERFQNGAAQTEDDFEEVNIN